MLILRQWKSLGSLTPGRDRIIRVTEISLTLSHSTNPPKMIHLEAVTIHRKRVACKTLDARQSEGVTFWMGKDWGEDLGQASM